MVLRVRAAVVQLAQLALRFANAGRVAPRSASAAHSRMLRA